MTASHQPDRPAAASNRKIYTLFLVVLAVAFLVKGALVLNSARRGKQRDYPRWHKIARCVLDDQPLADPLSRVTFLQSPTTAPAATQPQDAPATEPAPTAPAAGQPDGAAGAGADDEPPAVHGDKGLKFYKLPPAFAVYIAPFGLLSYWPYIVAWYLSSVLAYAVAVGLTMRLLHGRWLPADPRALIFPVLLTLPFAMDDVHNGTNNLHLLAMLVAGFYLASRKLNWAGGLAVGMAITWKAFPAAVLPVLLVTRRWRLLGWSLAATVLWTLVVPGLVRGYERQWQETGLWYQRIVGPYMRGARQRQWKTQGRSEKNQSTQALLHRLLRPVDAISGFPRGSEHVSDAPLYVNLASLSRSAVNAAFVVVVLLLLVGAAAVGLPRRAPPTADAWAADASLACGFVLLASPIAWTYFFTLILVPAALAAKAAHDPARSKRLRRLCVVAWVVSFPLMFSGLLDAARAVGALTLLAVLWYGVALACRWAFNSAGKDAGPAAS